MQVQYNKRGDESEVPVFYTEVCGNISPHKHQIPLIGFIFCLKVTANLKLLIS